MSRLYHQNIFIYTCSKSDIYSLVFIGYILFFYFYWKTQDKKSLDLVRVCVHLLADACVGDAINSAHVFTLRKFVVFVVSLKMSCFFFWLVSRPSTMKNILYI